jgi:hypothetical protein
LDPEVVVEDELVELELELELDFELVDEDVVVDDELVVVVGSGTVGVVVDEDDVGVHVSLSEVMTP